MENQYNYYNANGTGNGSDNSYGNGQNFNEFQQNGQNGQPHKNKHSNKKMPKAVAVTGLALLLTVFVVEAVAELEE